MFKKINVKIMAQNVSSNGLLPISPVMDDNFHEARQRYRQPKLNRERSLTPLQQAVRKNASARALCTPLRKCRLTGVILPRFFLLEFCAISNPKTGVPWYLPRSLTSDRPLNEVISRQKDVCQGTSSIISSLKINEVLSHTPERDIELNLATKRSNDNSIDAEISVDYDLNTIKPSGGATKASYLTPKIGGGTYLLRSYHALNSLQTKSKNSSKGILSQHFLTQNIRNHPLALDTFQTACFRPDMADFVLTLKRRRVLKALILVTSKFRGYITKFNPTKSLKTSQVAAVLLLGPLHTINQGEVISEKDFRSCMQKSPEDVPIFDLRLLLGDEILQKLRSSNATRWNSDLFTIKNRNYSQFLLARLWELEGYLTPLLP